MEQIDHNRSVVAWFEMMFMFHELKRTSGLFIDKQRRLLHIGDPYTQYPCLEKVFPLPGDGFVPSNKAKPCSSNGLVLVLSHGFFVQFNIATEIEHPFHGCLNKSCKMYQWHGIWIMWVKLLFFFPGNKWPQNQFYEKGILTTFPCKSLVRTFI